MIVGDICSREVYVVRRDEPLATAVKEMRDRHVGATVVAERSGDIFRPVGIVTDRDAVRGQLERRADLSCLTVGEVMTADPMVIDESATVEDAIGMLGRRGVRRAPVVARDGDLVGIVTLDDLLPVVARELTVLADLVASQAARERRP